MTQAVIENYIPRHFQTWTFTTTASGDRIGDGQRIYKNFALQVKMTGTVTSWTVVLEGSLNGTNYETIIDHTNASPGDGKVRWEGDIAGSPCLYFRVRCSALALGAGTDIVVGALGL